MIAHARLRNQAADALAFLHILLVGFFSLGWILPWSWSYWLVLAGGVCLQLIWLAFNNACPLTLIENWLRGEPVWRVQNGSPPPHFVASVLERVTGREISPFTGDLFVYGILYTSMAAAAWRLWG